MLELIALPNTPVLYYKAAGDSARHGLSEEDWSIVSFTTVRQIVSFTTVRHTLLPASLSLSALALSAAHNLPTPDIIRCIVLATQWMCAQVLENVSAVSPQ
jgi:hypothetical protein